MDKMSLKKSNLNKFAILKDQRKMKEVTMSVWES